MADDASSKARLIGVSIVLDGRRAVPELVDVAGLASRLGFGVWWREPPLAGPAADVVTLLGAVRNATGSRRVGLILDLESRGNGVPGAAAALAEGGRLALVGHPRSVAAALASLPARSRFEVIAPHAAGLPAIHPRQPVLIAVSADRDLGSLAAEAVAAGERVLAEVPVSIGRTTAEASARAGSETLFEITGHPAQQGLFGTLEQCQYRAAELAHAGVSELVCHLPGGRGVADVADVLAQLRAVATVGRDVLRPGEPPSPAPPPPVGWGGRRAANVESSEP
jgi:hypothetical protein